MKLIITVILVLLMTTLCVAQTGSIPQTVKSAFEGTWQHKEKYFANTVKIHFESGKDYALFTDVGTGVAPSRKFNVHIKGNLLILPAVRNQNDYIEMEIIKGKLYLRIVPVQWDENEKMIRSDNIRKEQRVFKRIDK